MGWEISNPPEHGNPNTGYYEDPFGSPQYVYAVGNPEDDPVGSPRYQRGQEKASGYGIIRFDQVERTIKLEAYRFLADTSGVSQNQFPGWPYTINQIDNYGRKVTGYLPVLSIRRSRKSCSYGHK